MPDAHASNFGVGDCCICPCAGPAPLGIATTVAIRLTSVAIEIIGATQLEYALEATQLGMGIGSAPEGA
jgi:hypothetical protein